MAVDIVVFVVFILAVITLALWQSRTDKSKGAKDAQDYFLAGRNLSWFVVGASIFASNIGSEHLVGLAGSGTTGHAVISLNRQDKKDRKYILVEQGEYFEAEL